MSRAVGVLGALHGPEELAFVTAVESLAPQVVLSRRCGDVAELLAAAEAGLGRLAVVSADLPGLDRDAVSTLLAAGVRPLALADPPEGWLAERTRALGITVVVGPGEAVEAVAREAARLRASGEPRDDDGALRDTGASSQLELEGAVEVSEDWSVADAMLAEEAPAGPAVLGSLLAVWGPTGAPGRTTVAVNLAAELAALGHGEAPSPRSRRRGSVSRADAGDDVLLVDADTYGGTVGQVLGLLDESPGIAAAARAAGQGTLDRAALALLAPLAAPGLRVLTGISRAARWAEVPGPALDVVWDTARTIARWTVVDCGFSLEDDEALSYDTRAPRRNAATLSALAAADLVLVVGGADPIGVQRLVRALGELDDAGIAAPRVVLANRVRASAVGPRPGELVAQALERYAGVSELRLVPEDRAALDAAVLRGQALREVVPGSAVRKALAGLAADLEETRAAQLEPAPSRRAARRAVAR